MSPADLRSLKHAFSGQLFRVKGLGVSGIPAAEYGPHSGAVPVAGTASASGTAIATNDSMLVCEDVGSDWVDAVHAELRHERLKLA